MEVRLLTDASLSWSTMPLALHEICSRITPSVIRAGKSFTVLFHSSESEDIEVLHISTRACSGDITE